MSKPLPQRRTDQIPWPTPEQLERFGMVRCRHEAGCGTYVNPLELRSGLCAQHARHARRERRERVR